MSRHIKLLRKRYTETTRHRTRLISLLSDLIIPNEVTPPLLDKLPSIIFQSQRFATGASMNIFPQLEHYCQVQLRKEIINIKCEGALVCRFIPRSSWSHQSVTHWICHNTSQQNSVTTLVPLPPVLFKVCDTWLDKIFSSKENLILRPRWVFFYWRASTRKWLTWGVLKNYYLLIYFSAFIRGNTCFWDMK